MDGEVSTQSFEITESSANGKPFIGRLRGGPIRGKKIHIKKKSRTQQFRATGRIPISCECT